MSRHHDFPTLRLHPDETCVPSAHHECVSLQDSRTFHDGCNAHGNHIALDAASFGMVLKIATKGGHNDTLDIPSRASRRTKRCRMNDDDVEFLGNSFRNGARCAGVAINADERGTMTWPVPSSDLLKCIHHFTSQYYAARGLLFHQSRAYRREVRQGRARVAQAADSVADADNPLAEGVGQGGNELWNDEDITKNKEFSSGKCRTFPESNLDMYKAFDGSALIAIGMPRIPFACVMLNDKKACCSKSTYRS
ncbi:hypothetical protein F5148DRAFT_1178266, partial [Russula earlei]